MEAKNVDSDTSAYQMVFSALDELEFGSLRAFFETKVLEDEMLFLMESEEELRNVLTKELGLPFGQAFKFSRYWFSKCHQQKAQRESKVQTTEGKITTPNGNNELFPTTAIDGSEHEDGQQCGIQGGTHHDQQTTLPKKSPYSSKEKSKENCKEQLGKQGDAQSGTDPKSSLKEPVTNDSIEVEDGKLENEHEKSKGNIPWSDRNNDGITERTSSAQSVGTTGAGKPYQSVEKVPSHLGRGGIDNEPFSVSDSSKSSMPQDAGLPQISHQKGGAKKQSLSVEGHGAPSVQVSKCVGRLFGVKVAENNISYQKGFVLDAEENKEVEYKSFSSAHPSILPWKIMAKTKKFICACLNAGSKGIIYFGVGDNQEQNSKFQHGEIIGLKVENIKDDITKALQFLLDDHIKSDDGPLQKGGEQNCINIHFVPVVCQGNHDNLYVVEIEVSRDWRFCKDNVFHSKTWIEKPGGNKEFTGKRGLNDLFKVKDTWDDVAVRTKGASTCVKQHEVKRQVREPLETNYKEWKRETKLGANEFGVGHNPDDSDFKMYHTMVKERLFGMNIKEYHYILVANKVPPQYRGTPHLSFLQSIPWVAVFDLFDAASKKDGLHFICNETTDARRANVKTLDDFRNISSDWNASKDCPLPKRGTTWILQLKQLQDEEWITCSAKDYFYRTLSAYKQYFPSGRLVIAILGLGENAVMEMSDIAESCFSILGGETARKCVTIISESKNFSDALIKNSKAALRKQLRECSLTDISWEVLKEIVREMVGPTEFMERGATTKLPYFTGQKEVLNKVIHSWHDLEVYCPEPRVPKVTEEIEKARNAFYKGTQASQINLFYNHTIERTLEQEITQKIDQAVKSLSTQSRSSERICSVRTFTVPYEPGSGATTLCRRILWNKRKDYRCAVVKAVTKDTDFQIDQLQRKGYNETQHNFSPPVLALLDNLSESDTRGLSERLITRETKCVIITTYPIQTTGSTVDFEMKPLRQLDENEMSHVRNILINITRDSGRRREAEEVLEREKRFIWFGLELFGREYVKIRERLQNHIESTLAFLGDSHAIHEKLLHFCCFLHFYSNGSGILPHAFTVDVLNESSHGMGEGSARKTSIHDQFGGLLLEGFSESYGYHGWRPAHSLVSEVVKSKMNVGEIAVELVENAERGKAYVNKFLREQLFQILLHRKRVSNQVSLPQEDEEAEDSISPDEENEVNGIYEVRTRYSPLILDILGGENGSQRTLDLLITVCQKASQHEDKAYAWQQLARFMAYEMRFKQLENTDDIHSRLYDAMNLSKRNESQLPMPETGIDAAHIAVDIAIRLQPNYSHHYSTKGVLYVLQLRDVNIDDGHILVSSLPDVIDIGRKALKVYDQAIQKMRGLNFYSVNGKIQVIVLLLKIMKSLPSFCLSENSSFTRYLESGEIPQEMEKLLQKDDHNFVQSLGQTTLQLLNTLFKDIKYRQLTTCDENEFRGLSTANLRACKLRQEFYGITGFDRSRLVTLQEQESLSPSSKRAPDVLQVAVQDTLFKKNETSYSGWSNLDKDVVLSIYRLLKPICLQGFGNHDNMLIFSRACLRLPRQDKPPVEELDKVVQAWIKKFPDSEWAHLFNYMIHFPFPDGGLAATNSGTLASIKKCCEMVQKRTGWRARKSAAEYFLGNGTGLAAIVSRQEFPALEKRWRNTKTDFWRSKEVSETLVRVRGQKASTGVITYRGIQLRFDDILYPKESRDDLWFYVGFSVAGPYAYDPVDKDSYSSIVKKAAKGKFSAFPSSHTSNEKGSSGPFAVRPGRGKRRERNRSKKQMRNSDVTDMKEETHISNDKSSCGVSAVGRGTGKPRELNTGSEKHRNLDVTDMKEETHISNDKSSCAVSAVGRGRGKPRERNIGSENVTDMKEENHISNDKVSCAVSAVGRGRGKPRERNIGIEKQRNPDVKDMKEETHISNDKRSCAVSAVGRGRGKPREPNIGSENVTDMKEETHISNDKRSCAVSAVGRGRGKPPELNIGSEKHRNLDVTDMKEETHISNDKRSCAVSAVGRGRGKPPELNIGSEKQRNPDVNDFKEETHITSTVSRCQAQLPCEPCDGRRKLANPSPGSRSTAPLPFQGPAETAIPLTYASALKQGEANHEKERGKVRSQQPVSSAARKEIEWKRGHQGEKWREFKLTHVDEKGRLHYGSLVRGACKSVECRNHTNKDSSLGINRCPFAHSWKGDTIEFVCTKCTEDNKPECRQKKEHEEFIWNLGPYITKAGVIWKGTDKKIL